MKKEYYSIKFALMTLSNTGSETVLYTIQKELIKKQFFDEREKEKLIDEITNRVLSRIYFSLDTSEAIEKTKQLKKELENLTKFK